MDRLLDNHRYRPMYLQVPSIAQCVIAVSGVFGLGYDSIDLVLRQSRGGRNPHLLFAAGGFIRGRHRHDAVRVHFKRDVNLRHAARRRRYAHQLKPAQAAIAAGDLALALQNVNLD